MELTDVVVAVAGFLLMGFCSSVVDYILFDFSPVSSGGNVSNNLINLIRLLGVWGYPIENPVCHAFGGGTVSVRGG